MGKNILRIENLRNSVINSPDICGFDEAGRGPLAGPVSAAAVVLGQDFPIELLADSKSLSPSKIKKVKGIIIDKALAFGLGFANHLEIDRLNILNASMLAMKRAWLKTQKMLDKKI